MIRKLTIAAALLGLLMPAMASSPEQINTYPDGFFYSSGRSYLGVGVKDITSERVSALKLKEERGVEVTTVDQDSPAGKAGLKEHDVILDYNGTKVESEEQLRRMIRETPPGRNVTLGVSRDGNPVSITAQIGDRGKLSSKLFKMDHSAPALVIPDMPEARSFNMMPFDVQVLTFTPLLGVQVDNLNQQLGEYFGVKNGEGLLVKSVEKGSAAEKAGLKAGDVITHADNEKIADRSDLRRILRSHRNGGKVTVGIMRDRHEQNLTIDLPSAKAGDSSGLDLQGPEVQTIEDLQSALKELQPEISDAIQQKVAQLKPELLQAQAAALQKVKPVLEKNMQQIKTNMKGLQKELEQMQKAWQEQLGDLI